MWVSLRRRLPIPSSVHVCYPYEWQDTHDTWLRDLANVLGGQGRCGEDASTYAFL